MEDEIGTKLKLNDAVQYRERTCSKRGYFQSHWVSLSPGRSKGFLLHPLLHVQWAVFLNRVILTDPRLIKERKANRIESRKVLGERMTLKEESQGLSLGSISISPLPGLKRKSSPWIRWWPHYQCPLPRYFLTGGENGLEWNVIRSTKKRKDTWTGSMVPVPTGLPPNPANGQFWSLFTHRSLSFSLQLQHKDVSHFWFIFHPPSSNPDLNPDLMMETRGWRKGNQHFHLPLLLVPSNQISNPYFWQLFHPDSNWSQNFQLPFSPLPSLHPSLSRFSLSLSLSTTQSLTLSFTIQSNDFTRLHDQLTTNSNHSFLLFITVATNDASSFGPQEQQKEILSSLAIASFSRFVLLRWLDCLRFLPERERKNY